MFSLKIWGQAGPYLVALDVGLSNLFFLLNQPRLHVLVGALLLALQFFVVFLQLAEQVLDVVLLLQLVFEVLDLQTAGVGLGLVFLAVFVGAFPLAWMRRTYP